MWIDIKDWENLYEVNEQGEVRNKLTGKLLAGDVNSAGYHRICLYNKEHDPPKQRFFRHRLVAQHFIPNPSNYPEVNHIDANKGHNFKENLEWCTRKYNEIHSRMIGIKEYKKFTATFENGDTKTYNTTTELALELGITRATVKCWLHKTNNGFKKYNIKNVEYI